MKVTQRFIRFSRMTILIPFLLSCSQSRQEHVQQTMSQLKNATMNVLQSEPSIVLCPALSPSDQCELKTAGEGGSSALMIYGDLLAEDTVYVNGGIEINDAGKIVSLGCLSAPQNVSVLSCPGQVVSPSLINPHDHLSYNQNFPGGQQVAGGPPNPNWLKCNDPQNAFSNSDCVGYRYDRRNEWRKGLDGKPEISAPWGGTDLKKAWNELRHVLAGTTSVAGSGGQIGLVRNPDVLALMEGLETPQQKEVYYDTFPLGDMTDVTGRNYGDCAYPAVVTEEVLDNLIFLPHVAEGINEFAHNELFCLTGKGNGSVNLKAANSTFIHSVAAGAQDASQLQNSGMTAVWSPRSNISLYGNTAQVRMYDVLGLRLALSTDWTPSGSINMLRELQCAADFNARYFDGHFSKTSLWQMVTTNGARSLGIDDQVGRLKQGQWADISIFKRESNSESYYDAVIDGRVERVSLVLRGGTVLYGQENIVMSLDPQCEPIPSGICGVSKAVCLKETGFDWQQISDDNAQSYPLYFCGDIPDEPSCTPARYQEYSGAISFSDSDGDGIENTDDNCPRVFNPIRPMDNGVQSDYNKNGIGDACDPSPL